LVITNADEQETLSALAEETPTKVNLAPENEHLPVNFEEAVVISVLHSGLGHPHPRFTLHHHYVLLVLCCWSSAYYAE